MPVFVQKAFINKERMFRENIFHPLLDTHKLNGKYKDFWAFTIVGQYRAMFSFLTQDMVALINIGTHSIYR